MTRLRSAFSAEVIVRSRQRDRDSERDTSHLAEAQRSTCAGHVPQEHAVRRGAASWCHSSLGGPREILHSAAGGAAVRCAALRTLRRARSSRPWRAELALA